MSRPRGKTQRAPSLQHPGGMSSRAVEDSRRPAIPPGICRHSHFWGNCSICKREWDDLNGFVAPRL